MASALPSLEPFISSLNPLISSLDPFIARLDPVISALKFYSVVVIASATFIFLFSSLVFIDNARRRRINLPGPKGWPLIGVGLDLPARPRKMLNTYRKKYGDVFKVRMGWYDWVFFNTPEGVKEVFDKQVSGYTVE